VDFQEIASWYSGGMSEEIIDIVDLDRTVLYPVAKSEAHRKGLLHRTVIAQIHDKQGNWLLVKQASDRQDAGQYVSPVGGHVKSGESDEEALRRETLEEVGLAGFGHELVGRFVFERKVIGRHENHYFIVYRITTDNELVLNHEAVSYKAFSQDELKQAIKKTPHLFGGAFFALLEQFYPEMLA
jgi:isopentenyl-diphosphate delta-isomerase